MKKLSCVVLLCLFLVVGQAEAVSIEGIMNAVYDRTNGRLRLKIESYDSTANTTPASLEGIVNDIYDSSTLALTVSLTGTLSFDGGAVFNESGDAVDFRVESDNNPYQFFVDGSADAVGINTSTPRANLDILDAAAEQLRLTFTDNSKYWKFTVDTNHDLTLLGSSTGQMKIQPTTDSTDFFQVLDADGGTTVLNVDSTNERVGVGIATPTTELDVVGAITTDSLNLNDNTTAAYDLIIDSDSTVSLGADRTLTIDVNNADRAFLIEGDVTVDQDYSADAAPTFEALHINDDTATSYDVILDSTDSSLTADHTLDIDLTNGDRTFDMSGDLTVEASSVVNQDYSTDAAPTFEALHINDDTATSYDVILDSTDSSLTADHTLDIDLTNGDRTIDMAGNLTVSNDFTVAGTNAGTLDFTAASKTLNVEDTATVDQDYTVDASPTWESLHLNDDTTAAYDLILDSDSTSVLTADHTLTFDVNNGDWELLIEADSSLNQDLTTDADVEFNRVDSTDFYWEDEFCVSDAPQWTTNVTTGSVAAQALVGCAERLTTGASSTNEESLDWNDIVTFVNTQRPAFEFPLDVEQITNIEFGVGLKESEGVGVDDYIKIMFDASAQNTVYLQASTGGTPTTDQGAVLDTDTHIYRVEWNSDTELEWYIDGVSQGTVATNVPTVSLQPAIEVFTEENAAHYIDIYYFKIWQDRS